MWLSPFFELENVSKQDSIPCFGDIAVVFQSLLGTVPQISQRRDFADEDF